MRREQVPSQADAIELLNQLENEGRLLAKIFATYREQLIASWEAAEHLGDRERIHAEITALKTVRENINATARRHVNDD
jgi:hypothetical protein